MLRIRNADGTVQDIPQGTFIELVNPHDQSVGSVWFQQSVNMMIRIVPGTVDAARYASMFGVRFSPMEILRSDLVKPS